MRITDLQGDEEFQSSIALALQVSSLLNSKLGLRVEKEDIDIAHRIGKYHREKIQPVIVRFIRRQTKSDVKRNAKLLKGSGIFLNKDLTKLNAEILASVRLKDPETVEWAWSFDWKLYAPFREACWSTVAQIILANQNTDLESGERIGYSEEHVWCSSDVRVLIAGDSNVHRLKSACPPNARIDFLPVSGAKYVSDRKGFRKLLHLELMSGCYDILYLHLGSNDVCCKDSDFYRCVTEILDVVFSVCTEIHVVLCVILPRDFDVRMFPRWPLSGAQLRNYCQWIRSANSMLWELSHHVPSVRYMDYGATGIGKDLE
ncbi:uncharacterized protein LOC127834191 [Dreissena polymorpha]|uniref:uncharacterized protein LOC127834191 n=1 Tax=Dreissena polymorpha TaxID=45954 RepID=UPI0022646497|nr:uncharacterized protein LOC127834191 [Dreissena polymorpha]